MKRFAAIVHIDVEDDVSAFSRRKEVMDALRRCLKVDLETEEDSPAPVIAVSVDVDSVAYYDDVSGRPTVYIVNKKRL
jgi:hypothetical protein